MKILYIGDIMGDPGIETVEAVAPKLRRDRSIDLVIAQGENVSDGRGMTLMDFKRLRAAGIDFFTGGNHILDNDSIFPELNDPQSPVIRPANFSPDTVGKGYKYIEVPAGKVLVVSLLGSIVGKDANMLLENPLTTIDKILTSQESVERSATIVDFHGDYSSEKVVIGHYLDGRVSAVVGDHWHVPTADARVLTAGTAHITDVGMVGALDGSLGVTYDSIIPRWRDGKRTRNNIETKDPRQFNAVLIDSNSQGLADSIEQIQIKL
ncbi:MAG TPA: TIGR00282 family metallophosphoesterase [Candidatus Saccharimonadales bacterium]|nr:TIGR00282 family metallophosphoesterase [Candidatus Saccharimonadales bacterium]